MSLPGVSLPYPNRGGGGGGHIVPPGTLPQISQERLELQKLSDNLNDLIFNTKKNYWSTTLHPPLVTIATSKVDACF